MRDDERAGLAWFAVEAASEAEREAAIERLKRANMPVSGGETRDPFGTRVRFIS
jgi:catechol 2,3-dioxygenase